MLEDDTNELHIEKDKENDTYRMDHPDALTKGQKLAAAGLAFFAFLTVILWSLNFKNSISNPFDLRANDRGSADPTSPMLRGADSVEAGSCATGDCGDEVQVVGNKDTDGDGLWDFDEENVYYTSIYLEDSDSDGISDKDEIDRGDDPNCASGQNCSSSAGLGQEASGDNTIISEDDMSQADMLEFLEQLEKLDNSIDSAGSGSGDEQAMNDLLGGKASVNELRAMLLGAGFDEKSLGALSDEELMSVYNDMIK